jgi:hypothetical protein
LLFKINSEVDLILKQKDMRKFGIWEKKEFYILNEMLQIFHIWTVLFENNKDNFHSFAIPKKLLKLSYAKLTFKDMTANIKNLL